MAYRSYPEKQGLYDPQNEKDACGVGFVANIDGTQSHEIVERGIQVLINLLHRGALGGDMKTGDGAGILTQIPDGFFREALKPLKIELPAPGHYGIGMFFLPQDKTKREKYENDINVSLEKEGVTLLGWREVPVDDSVIDGQAKDEQPVIKQCFLTCGALSDWDLERKLYITRRVIENTIEAQMSQGEEDFYAVSFSCHTITYKGLFIATQLKGYYPDLQDNKFISAVAVVHQRYSTNTFPSWSLAQPFRYLAHNGEINTLRGNIRQMTAREGKLESPLFGEDIKKLLPIIDDQGSDSACLDNALELLTTGGREIEHAMMMLVPQAWGEKYELAPDQKGFYEYHAGLMEPWDGPAALAFTDGLKVGASLDRNGLRPARYTITKDGFMVFASEAGVLEIKPEDVAERGALRPGQMILIDLKKKRVLKDGEVKFICARKQPYRRWVEENKISIHGFYSAIGGIQPDEDSLVKRQKLFGYTREDMKVILSPMASTGAEPIGSMGNDEPLAVFSEKPQLMYNYFKQLFAQITNPAIDPIREELVMSLMTFIGNPPNILSEAPQHARLIKLTHPILSNQDLERLKSLGYKGFRATVLSLGVSPGITGNEMEAALEALCQKAEERVKEGESLLVLSDKDLPEDQIPLPALLAVAAVNQYLIRQGLRSHVGILLESGEPREVHHMAVLLGYGATAINPYLAFESIASMKEKKQLEVDIDTPKALENYIKAICKGLRKVLSKMGISTLRSYRSAQIFEAIGLNTDLVSKYFTGTASRVEGIGLDEIAGELNLRYEEAVKEEIDMAGLLPVGGKYSVRMGGERHLLSPQAIALLQKATRADDYSVYKEYARIINDQTKALFTLRGMFNFKKGTSVPIDEVEPVESIMSRFVTGAMSFGSISREAHETLALAMNRIGGMSNSGEGGEDRKRFIPLPGGDSKCSAIKQVASGRFGVTAEYLASAKEIQIKIAQGAKPGEGGQLPGHKVNKEIASVRHSTPGVTLISPPPHHDIYSIEDIAQLIFDLKNANPGARISVKLVSEVGVGTIAAGVSKAHADMVLISGYDGGTGASPQSSIKHAGGPWELGVSETHQTLVLNKLRDRIRVQADGQMKTGRDIVVAALLGAEEYGFATMALVVCGCIMMRKCQKNTCPVGIATQDPELRRRYSGKPEYVVNFFRMISQEVREYMAEMGFRKMDDMIGRADMLEMNGAIDFWKARGLDFSRILTPVDPGKVHRRTVMQDHGIDDILDRELIKKAEKAIENRERVVINMPIRNINRTATTMLSGIVAKKYGHEGLEEDTLTINFTGSAGQSFGAFGAHGCTFVLHGEANDYLGKGLSGARIVVKPEGSTDFDPSENIITGNVNLYGATGGEVYINGLAGERFCIRNSGAKAVVEGVGDHGCEYMTGGRVVVLGETGVNFGAGMSGGIAYIYDINRVFDARCNLSMVDLELVAEEEDIKELKELLENHLKYTGSAKAAAILEDWENHLGYFVKVFPMEYRRVLGQMSKEDEAVEREEVVHG